MSLDIWLWIPADTGDPETESLRIPGTDHFNYTHNVTPMWKEAGVYEALYNSDGKPAGEFIETLRQGIKDMEDHPRKYHAFNPENGWGDSETALNFLRNWLSVCVKHPKALIGVSK